MSEINRPAYGELILNWIHCPKCSASRMTERAMRMWRYSYPHIRLNIIGRERLGVEDALGEYLYQIDPESGLKMKALPTFFITWSERPHIVWWKSSGGIDSRKYKDVKEFYEEIEEAFKETKRRVNDAIKHGKI